ncbi:MAG: hypothetical protein CMJ75_04620 [Planctomycetaceae bacterium]|nr:hypothetical protein [Planctomycetaceae bacterium]
MPLGYTHRREAGKMDSIRWAVLGAGRFGSIHARAMQNMPGVELVALCTRNPRHQEQATRDFPGVEVMSEADQLLARDDVDTVTIATHWQDHHELTLQAFAADKNVLLEKPLAPSRNACLEVLAAARNAKGIFMVGHICRFDPRVSLAQQAILSGRIGKVVSMSAKRNLPVNAPLRLDKISPLMGDGVHDADLMMWFTGTLPSRVYGRQLHSRKTRFPEAGWAILEFGDHAVGVIETHWGLPANVATLIDARMEIVGTQGKLEIDCSHTGLELLDADGTKMQDTSYWPVQHGQIGGALRTELDYFAECVRRQQAPAVVTPIEAARAVIVMEAAEASAARGQPVELTWPVA